MKRAKNNLLICLLLVTLSTPLLADWPNWGGGPDHTFSAKGPFPTNLKLNWKRQLHTPTPAWPKSQNKLRFDDAHGVVISKGLLLVNSAVTDSITAYTVADGKEKWSFRTNGPVRFSPAISKDRVYFGSDDGYVYCLDLTTGKEIWRLRGGPDERRLIGNDRFISMWPVRGAPVVKDDIVYFAAGIWPFMGVFIHAVDAKTGEKIWMNSGHGSKYLMQPHRSPAFAGVAPQGYMTVSDDIVLVPGGRSIPAAFDRKTGKLLYFNHSEKQQGGLKSGGFGIRLGKDFFCTSTTTSALSDGGTALIKQRVLVIDGDTLYSLARKKLIANPPPKKTGSSNRRGKIVSHYKSKALWSKPTVLKQLICKIGDHFIGLGNENELIALNLTTDKTEWSHKFSSVPHTIAYSQGNLIVSTETGEIYCFSTEGTGVEYKLTQAPAIKKTTHPIVAAAIKQLKRTSNAYALVVLPDPGMIAALVTSTDLDIVVLESDKAKVDALRNKFSTGQVEVIHGQPGTMGTPAYFADLIICGKRSELILKQSAVAKRLINSIRPYGGIALLPASAEVTVKKVLTVNEKTSNQGTTLTVSRPGALKGSASWTHQNADSGNSLMSKDSLVKTPLGLLWFGGPSNDDVLPRHGHGPSPQVIGGRLFIEGANMIRAVDIYTGRMLWQKSITDVGKYHDITDHFAGAGEIGGNYVCTSDAIYVITPEYCLKLNAETGKTDAKFMLPDGAKWGSLVVVDDYLVVSGFPIEVPVSGAIPEEVKRKALHKAERKARQKNRPMPVPKPEIVIENADYASASKMLYVLNRQSGKIIWKRTAKTSYRHNAVIAVDDKIFCIDSVSDTKREFLKRRGLISDAKPTLYALSIKDGSVIWKDEKNVFGTWLSYSYKHNLLFQGGCASRDRAVDEVKKGMAVFKAATGELLWKNDIVYEGPVMLHHEKIITQGNAIELLTGKPLNTIDPITEKSTKWGFQRNYGCNTAIGSEHLITFRSAAAGYYDLRNNSGTGNIGGFKSSCTANLIAAGGILNAPDYTRTCNCSYQNQTSLAMVYMPDVESWTFSSSTRNSSKEEIKRMGLNFGAPGDRMTDDGTLWLEWPIEGGPSPKLSVSTVPETVQTFRQHSLMVKGSNPLKWVAASGITGLSKLSVDLRSKKSKGLYTIKLVFPSQKVKPFDVSLNGKTVLTSFSPSSGTPNDGTVVKIFKGVAVNGKIELIFSKGQPVISGLEVIKE